MEGVHGQAQAPVEPSGGGDPVSGLAAILLGSLEALATAGQAEAACRDAGKACAVLRGADPVQWRKFNALLHRLSRHVHWDE
ncbi:MAG: hypothetical protein J0I98_17815 [Mesorhizobium sp.]|jgi:hypothetical protein|nr:hypothetical protein [Mesorhizobium sp.]MBN9244644.1 hypothetical protein [Mesorhizobium sp.]